MEEIHCNSKTSHLHDLRIDPMKLPIRDATQIVRSSRNLIVEVIWHAKLPSVLVMSSTPGFDATKVWKLACVVS